MSINKSVSFALLLVAGASFIGAAPNQKLGHKQPYGALRNGVCAVHNQVAADTVTTAMLELGRYRPGVDLMLTNGGLELTDQGRERCEERGGCSHLQTLLAYQTLTPERIATLRKDFPFMSALRPKAIAEAFQPSFPAAQCGTPVGVLPHHLTYTRSIPAPKIDDVNGCTENLTYRCFSVSELPPGRTVSDLAQSIRAAIGTDSELDKLTRIFVSSDQELCVDPDGTGGDQIGAPYTGTPSCVDSTVSISYDPAFLGTCCTVGGVMGFFVQNSTDPSFMSCKTQDLAYFQCATADSAAGTNRPNKATDNDDATNWIAADTLTGHSLTVDLGAAVTLKGVLFKFQQAPTTGSSLSYTVQTAVNTTIWSTKKTASATQVWQNAGFASTSARWVKITVTSLPAGWSAAIGTVRVYN